MSRVLSLLYGGKKNFKKRKKRRNEADTPERTPRLAGSTNETRGLSQEPEHPRTLRFPGSLSWRWHRVPRGWGSLLGSSAELRRQSWARPGGKAHPKRRGGGGANLPGSRPRIKRPRGWERDGGALSELVSLSRRWRHRARSLRVLPQPVPP